MNLRASLLISAFALASADLAVAQVHDGIYTFAGNIGWVNTQHDQPSAPAGVVISEYTMSGYAYGANIGWIKFGGTPDNGVRFSNVNVDCGVNHDSAGELSGYAYSANVGWISFQWAAPGNPQRPRIDLSTGALSGYAYGANIGWVSLSTLVTGRILAPDTDSDGVADAWEMAHFGSLTTTTATSDSDGDGVTDVAEYHSMSDPNDAASFFKIIAHSLDAGMTNAELHFTTHPSRRYRLQWSPDLAVWVNDTTHGIFAPGLGTVTMKVLNFPTGSQRFFRVIAIKPLQN